MNGNNQNPKGGWNPNSNPQKNDKNQGQQKHGQQHGGSENKQGQAGQPEQKKHGWCASHKGPKAKCNCE